MVRNGNITGKAHRLLLVAMAVACFSPAWAQDTTARVIQMTGRVSLLRDATDTTKWALGMGSVVRPGQVIVTGPDGMATLQVSDGSTCEVFPDSQVVFRDNYSNWRDLVRLVLGHIKVHIEKLNGQPNPARVTTPTAVISVRGTVFDVQIEDLDDTTLVTLEEGEVRVRNVVQGGNEIILLPGDSVRVYRNQPLAQRTVDRSGMALRAVRAATQALYELLYRHSAGSGTGTGSSGGTVSGDHGKTGTGGTTTGTGGTTTTTPPVTPPVTGP
jgi:ferric-dicitrate binding protein FerR (iron transport regulator)